MAPLAICERNKVHSLEDIIRATFMKYEVSQDEYYIHQEAWDEIFYLFFHRLPDSDKDPLWSLLFESDLAKGYDAQAIVRQLTEAKK